MPRSFGLVDTKVQEAEYFLDRILAAEQDFFGVQCDAVAFAASARSITFSMQASLKGIDEFDEWYAVKQSQLKANRLARFFHEFRRVSQHIGGNAVVGGSRAPGERAVFHFGAGPELPDVPSEDVATACSNYFTLLLEVVYECYVSFNPLINGQWRFTKDHFLKIGKDIEDAEAELGFPRGWGKVSGFDESIRWKYLRRQADGCNIQSQFEQWLGKRVPHPDDEK